MTETQDQTPNLDRVRKLLAKAEAEGVTPPEAEALTAKAAELMAKYGIDRARLAAGSDPARFTPANRIIEIDNPWAQVRAFLLGGIAGAMRCQCVQLSTQGPGIRVHIFGSADDIERVDVLYTSLLLQMATALRYAQLPFGIRSPRAWRRSYLLGYATAVVTRVKAAEDHAREDAKAEDQAATGSHSTELVLRGREVAIQEAVSKVYPTVRKTRITYSGQGYNAGHSEGQRADIGGTRIGAGADRQLARSGG